MKTMGRMAVALGFALLTAACGGGEANEQTDAESGVELSATAVWTNDDRIEVDVESGLPDGALVSGWAVDHDRLDTDAPLDAADTGGEPGDGPQNVATVTDGEASLTLDVGHFEGETAVVEVSFIPSYDEQPPVVRETYDANEGDSWSALVDAP